MAKNKAAVKLGRLGGKAGGWRKLTQEQRTARARKAGLARAVKAGQKLRDSSSALAVTNVTK